MERLGKRPEFCPGLGVFALKRSSRNNPGSGVKAGLASIGAELCAAEGDKQLPATSGVKPAKPASVKPARDGFERPDALQCGRNRVSGSGRGGMQRGGNVAQMQRAGRGSVQRSMEVVQVREGEDARRRRRRHFKAKRAGKGIVEVKDDGGVFTPLLFIMKKKCDAPRVRGGVRGARGGAGKSIGVQVASRNKRGEALGRRAKKSPVKAITIGISMAGTVAGAQMLKSAGNIKSLRVDSLPGTGENDFFNPPSGNFTKGMCHGARIPVGGMFGKHGVPASGRTR